MTGKYTGAQRKRTNTPARNRQRTVAFRHRQYAPVFSLRTHKTSLKERIVQSGSKVIARVSHADYQYMWRRFSNLVSYSFKDAVKTWREMEWDFKPEQLDPKDLIPEEEIILDENGKPHL